MAYAHLNLEQFRLKTPDAATQDLCFGEGSLLYLQVACTYSEAELAERKLVGLLAGSISVFCALFVFVYADYLEQEFEIQAKLQDVQTVTAADYTLEFDISDDFFRKFLRDELHNKPDGLPTVVHFRNWLKDSIEQSVGRLVTITLTFHNSRLIRLLRARGDHIKREAYEQVAQVEEQIRALKTESIEQLKQPVTAFVTFETEEGYSKGLSLANSHPSLHQRRP